MLELVALKHQLRSKKIKQFCIMQTLQNDISRFGTWKSCFTFCKTRQEKQILVPRGWGYSTKFYWDGLSLLNCNQGCHDQGKSQEKTKFFPSQEKVRENFWYFQSQWKVREFCFPVYSWKVFFKTLKCSFFRKRLKCAKKQAKRSIWHSMYDTCSSCGQ